MSCLDFFQKKNLNFGKKNQYIENSTIVDEFYVNFQKI